ncbi:hypothetical protein [Phormidesmis sp. 146-33]
MFGRDKRAKREKILEGTTRLLSRTLSDLGNDPDAIDPDSLDLYRHRVKIAELQLSIVRALHAEARLTRPVVVALIGFLAAVSGMMGGYVGDLFFGGGP